MILYPIKVKLDDNCKNSDLYCSLHFVQYFCELYCLQLNTVRHRQKLKWDTKPYNKFCDTLNNHLYGLNGTKRSHYETMYQKHDLKNPNEIEWNGMEWNCFVCKKNMMIIMIIYPTQYKEQYGYMDSVDIAKSSSLNMKFQSYISNCCKDFPGLFCHLHLDFNLYTIMRVARGFSLCYRCHFDGTA